MKTLTRSELRDLLAAVRHAQPVSFSALTVVDAKKNPYGQIFKLNRVNAFIGVRQENSVNRQLAREGKAADFVAQERDWGTRVGPADGCNPLVQKGDRFYLSAQIIRTKPVYMVRAEGGTLRITPQWALQPYLPKERNPVHGLDRPIVWRDYSLEAITQMSLGGEQLRVRA